MRETPEAGRKRFELSVPQVAGSALAAVVAAKLASYFGVYGTILGAGVVSVIATCGGSFFQQLFRRTGEQLREAKGAPRPKGRASQEQEGTAAGEFGDATVYRARVKSWKRPVVAAALVFGVTMAGITTYELVSGNSFSGGRGTTVSDAVDGGRGAHSPKTGVGGPSSSPSSPSDAPGTGAPSTGRGGTPEPATPAPSGSPDGKSSHGPATPSTPAQVTPPPTPGGTTATPTTPEPSASSRSGTAVPGQDGPATP
ncbi:hypothetical protein OIB37_27515 [Streptomyces sp. NBC_00820]|uniref:hypothetical protein n=1 Tax=Streptomyces sp. NBC_00820 TaxID=2975842 RepID=UPI002ED416C2|nr:hypothetical protein OIB37_27515 [Streptomyces sp. NBC_00820]